MKKPWDPDMLYAMSRTTQVLCQEIQGCKLGYTQSDEISLLLTDFDSLNVNTQAWFDGNIQKMVSISASIATARFNRCMDHIEKPAYFDSRVFTIPDTVEVANYFLWRMQDAVRNSRQMLAQSLFSHKELHGKSCAELLDMCLEKGHNWNELDSIKKQGAVFHKVGGEWDIALNPPRNYASWQYAIDNVTGAE